MDNVTEKSLMLWLVYGPIRTTAVSPVLKFTPSILDRPAESTPPLEQPSSLQRLFTSITVSTVVVLPHKEKENIPVLGAVKLYTTALLVLTLQANLYAGAEEGTLTTFEPRVKNF